MATIAKIAVAAATYAIDKPYDYLVPDDLVCSLQIGMRVAVPFGAGSRVSDGIVLAIAQQRHPEHIRLKAIFTQLDEQPLLTPDFLKLALWMRERYFCTVYDAARVMLPAGLWYSLKDCWKIAPGVDREAAYKAAGTSNNERHLLDLLYSNNGWAELGQIRLAFGTADPNPSIRSLERMGIIVRETSATRGIGDKTELMAQLMMPPEDALAAIGSKRRRAPLQYSVIETLCAVGSVAAKELCYFTGASMTTLRTLEKAGFLQLVKSERYRSPQIGCIEQAEPPRLNEEQHAIYRELSSIVQGELPSAVLLRGVTGSGKTQVYIKLIHDLLEQGKGAIVLVPEIALTPQLTHRFSAQFGRKIAVLHSSLSAGERYDEWKRIHRGEASVVVGTRSAVFAPVHHLGLIIIDEEQEPSYKSEQTPRYHARDIAKYRCAKANAMLLMGSATPTIESMYYAKTGQYKLLYLDHRYNDQDLPSVEIVDMKQELRNGNGSCVSGRLYTALQSTLERGEQAILFLNRRGAHRMVSCGQCGETPDCPRCSVKLIYHSANNRLMCHHCGHSQPLPKVCPSCGGILSFIGVGIQKVEEELNALFPGTEILRMDADTISASNSHQAVLDHFLKDKVPILLGTQMIAKGLDFENVTFAGVLNADQMLYSEDYRAGERTFSLLTQVIGRAGRGKKIGRAVIQTYTPDNDVIRCAAEQDYDAFFQQEIRMRKIRQQPPFTHPLVISVSGLEETAVLRACMQLRSALASALEAEEYRRFAYRILGPAPAAVVKVNNRYRYRLTLDIDNCKESRQLIAHLLRKAMLDKQNRNLSFFADIDPQG